MQDINLLDLTKETSKVICEGNDLTIVASGFSTKLAKEAIKNLNKTNKVKSIELIDLRIISPINNQNIINSVKKTGKLIVIDGGWKTCGIGSEIISSVVENLDPTLIKKSPINISLKESPAPTSSILEKEYYISIEEIKNAIKKSLAI